MKLVLAAFKELRRVTDLTQAPPLAVLKRHLWLNLMEIKGTDETALLASPVSPWGLFGTAVDSFAEHFTAAQKSSQAMRHFLLQFFCKLSATRFPGTRDPSLS